MEALIGLSALTLLWLVMDGFLMPFVHDARRFEIERWGWASLRGREDAYWDEVFEWRRSRVKRA